MFQGEQMALVRLIEVVVQTDSHQLKKFQKRLESILLAGSLANDFESDERTSLPARAIVEALENYISATVNDRSRRKYYERLYRKNQLETIPDENESEVDDE